MRVKTLITTLLSVAILSSSLSAASFVNSRVYRQALNFYQNGMYDRARTLFETMPGDPMTDGYAVLCAIKLRSDDYPDLITRYSGTYPSSSLTSSIHFENARLLFDAKKYQDAVVELGKVSSESLSSQQMPEYFFKCGYSEFSIGKYPEAMQFFTVLDALPFSDYTSPGRYMTGMMYYNDKRFADAESCFQKISTDPRFKDLAAFYIVDCEFNQKNYDFTIAEGEKIYSTVPKERRERLARLISESCLVKGDIQKARQYYEGLSLKDMNRKDYFYAGTVMYSVNDYQGAIDNFNKMTDRSDSLGQVANYHLGNAYIRTRNQVAAMEAFHDASEVDFDPQITEDAMFNYAKLAFDLNKDTGGFKSYIKRYSTKAKGEQIYGYMALAALYDHDYAAAVEAYDNIDVLSGDYRSNYTKANFLRGVQLFSSNSFRDAAPYFRTAAYYLPKTDPMNQLSRYWFGESSYRSGNYQEAEGTYTELYNNSALDNMSEGDLLAYNIGYSYFKQQKYDLAAKWFGTYIASGNSLYREDAMNRRADCDFGRHDYKAAAASYQNVLTEFFSSNDIYPYYQQAISYGLAGDRKRKVAVLLHVEDATPDAPLYSEAYYELGRAQMSVNSNNDALRTFAHLRDNTKDKTYVVRALTGLGMVSRNLSEYDKALEYYKQVVSMMPQSEYAESAMSAIESIYQAKKQPEKFLEYVEQNSLSTSKTDAQKAKMYFNTAEQLYLAENWQQAIPTLQKYLDNYPDDPDSSRAQFYLAESYNATGEKEKACEWYSKAMGADPSFSFAETSRLKYADLSYSLERYQDAYNGYLALMSTTKLAENKAVSRTGMMRSAYRCKNYDAAILASDGIYADKSSTAALKREARYIKAKSWLAMSRRSDAMGIFKTLSTEPSTPEGAEANYIMIQDLYNTGKFEAVENEVYTFSKKAGNQSYWLAKAYIVLGDSFAERQKYDQAKATFESIRDGYTSTGSSDDVLDNVNMRLDRLKTLMNK